MPNYNKNIKHLLDRLGLSDTDSIYFFGQKSKWGSIFPSETVKKIEKIKPDSFYVFNNQPYILFFDLSAPLFQDGREYEIHKQVWSFDQSPLIFVIKETDIEIFNAFSFNKKAGKLEQIKLRNDENIEQLFSFWNLQSGLTWKWLQDNYYKKNIQEKRVSQKLFENIRSVRETLTNKANENSFTENEANILILRLIFIRYLIDRNVKLDETFITGSELNERRKSFVDLIGKPGKLNSFFEWLNDKFNGVLFKDTQIILSKERASQLALVFDGEIPEGVFQDGDFYFDVFDFSIIPVELISGIYESLIDETTKKLHSAVYTPSFLVEYILSNTIDLFFQDEKNKQVTECRVFDPSVGSGIFLVQAFRRMVDREIQQIGAKKITRKRLREIVCNNLFGIDINEQALKVTCFSIYIAMLDYFEPSSILPKFEFPSLIGSNLFSANFFNKRHEFNSVITSKGVDFILGNPPWKSDKDEVHMKWLKENNKTVGRYEIAQSFLLRSKDFMQSKTVSALIVTSTIFYNISTTTKKFKQEFLREFCIDRFLDLSAVRRLVFEEKNSPCSIVFYRQSDTENYMNNVVKHFSVKSNLFLKYYKALVIEKFDQKKILQKHFFENDWMFKVALYGNTLDFSLLKKLGEIESKIDDHIDNIRIFKGDGILKGTPKKDPFRFLIDLPIIENREVTNDYTHIDQKTKKLKLEDTFLESGRRIELFEGQHIYLKAQTIDETEISVSYCEKTAVHKHDVIAITTKSEINELKQLYAIFKSNLFTYFQYLTSSAWGVGTRPAIRLEELLNFPYTNSESADKKLIELVDAFIKPYQIFYKKFSLGEPQRDTTTLDDINKVVEEMYNIKGYEKDLINYVLDISRYQFQESKQQKVIRKVHDDEKALKSYADVFIQEFNNVYEDEYLQVEVYPLNHFIAMNFVFHTKKPKSKVIVHNSSEVKEKDIFQAIANNLSISEVSKKLFVQKDIKGFEENSFYIIKPNEYKCWHRAMAWYDVAEIKQTIEEAEIGYINKNLNA